MRGEHVRGRQMKVFESQSPNSRWIQPGTTPSAIFLQSDDAKVKLIADGVAVCETNRLLKIRWRGKAQCAPAALRTGCNVLPARH
jgi:hypothetical protein